MNILYTAICYSKFQGRNCAKKMVIKCDNERDVTTTRESVLSGNNYNAHKKGQPLPEGN